MHAIAVRQVQLARDAGALAHLPIDLPLQAVIASAWMATSRGGCSLIAECDSVCGGDR